MATTLQRRILDTKTPQVGDTVATKPKRPHAPVLVSRIDVSNKTGLVVHDLAQPDETEWGACCELAFGQPNLLVAFRPKAIGYFELAEVERLSRRLGKSSAAGELVEGDRVRVVRDVRIKGGENARGRVGVVVEAWSGCETDPACCCNELTTAPLQVELEALEGHFFADELVVVSVE